LKYLLVLNSTSRLIAGRRTLELPILVDGKDFFRYILLKTMRRMHT
jgi:hypothetical protein